MRRIINPLGLLKLHLAGIALAGLVILLVTFVATGEVGRSSDQANQNSRAALLSAQAESRVGDILALITERAHEFTDSAEFAALTPGEQEALRTELARRDMGPPTSGLPDVKIDLSMRQTIAIQDALLVMNEGIAQNIGLLSGSDQTLANTLQASAQRIMDNYFDDPTPANLRMLTTLFSSMRTLLTERVPALFDSAQQHESDLKTATTWARGVLFGVVLLFLGLVLVFGAYMARRIRITMGRLDAESEALEEASQRLQYRNNQLNALYNVFTEITESLSLQYVIKSTVSETLRVMQADGVTLRLLQGDDLNVVGAMNGEGVELTGIPSVKLGEGPSGRVARRGRTQRITRGAQDVLGPAPNGTRTESGIIVPLIVGARIVGTLACWSRVREAFGEEDERILEMMASQVATAIVAADTTERSERRALRDPLTGLPNRRQLDQDLADGLGLNEEDARAVVAMVDIDHFKRLNDEFGHKVGDITLQKIAWVMRNTIREKDRIYRYGGEEFVIVFAGASAQEAETLANRVRSAVESTPLSGDHLEPVGPVTISTGLAYLPAHSPDAGELIQLADKAMYAAKEGGRNRVTVWTPDLKMGRLAA